MRVYVFLFDDGWIREQSRLGTAERAQSRSTPHAAVPTVTLWRHWPRCPDRPSRAALASRFHVAFAVCIAGDACCAFILCYKPIICFIWHALSLALRNMLCETC